MSLRGACVDTAYQRRKVSTRRKVDGRTLYEPTEGPPFRCRLTLTQAAERTANDWTTTEPQPSLLTLLKDKDHNLLEFENTDTIRVVSRELGEATYEVSGEPQPIRKKRRLIGWQLPLSRVREATPAR